MIESVYEGIYFRRRVSFNGNCVSGLVLSNCVWDILRRSRIFGMMRRGIDSVLGIRILFGQFSGGIFLR